VCDRISFRISVCHSLISRADQGYYDQKVYLRVQLKERMWFGGCDGQKGFRSQSVHRGRFVQDGISLVHTIPQIIKIAF